MTMITCPACGKPVNMTDIGKHAAKDCKPFEMAKKDAGRPGFQARTREQLTQDKLALKGQSFSERWFDFFLDSNWMRRHWFPSFLAYGLLSWYLGLATPNSSWWFTVIMVPIGLSFFLIAVFNWNRLTGKVKKLVLGK